MARVLNANFIRERKPGLQNTLVLNNSLRFLNKGIRTKDPNNLDFPLEAVNDFVLDFQAFLSAQKSFRHKRRKQET